MSGITPSTEWEFELRRENFINLRINWEKLLKDIRRKNTGLWEQPSYRASNYKVFQINTTIYLSNAFVFNPFTDFCHQNKVIFLISIALFTLKSENKSRITSASPNPAAILRFWFSARLYVTVSWQPRWKAYDCDARDMFVTNWNNQIIPRSEFLNCFSFL